MSFSCSTFTCAELIVVLYFSLMSSGQVKHWCSRSKSGVWEEKSACREELWVVPVTLDTHNPDISKSWLTRRILYGYYTLLKWFVFLSCLDDCVIQILNTRIKHDKRHEERHRVHTSLLTHPAIFPSHPHVDQVECFIYEADIWSVFGGREVRSQQKRFAGQA